MKKLLLLLLILGCSGGGNDSNDMSEPTSITFKIQEIWDGNRIWIDNTYYNSIQFEPCNQPMQHVGAQGQSESGLNDFSVCLDYWCHKSIDTLVINKRSITKPYFLEFHLTGREEVQSHPTRIGHIEFSGFWTDDDKIRLHPSQMINNGETPIIYFTSNKSEEWIDNASVKNFLCESFNFFDKSSYDGPYRKSTEFYHTVPVDGLNSALEINDTISHGSWTINGNKQLGEGWDGNFNSLHLIVDKTVNY